MIISSLLFTGAAGTVLTAHAFETLGGYLPCHLCLIERYAYYFAVLASIAAFFAARAAKDDLARIIFALIALAFLANAGLGFYHSGVEWKWWLGPTECSGGSTIQWGEGGSSGIACEQQGRGLRRGSVALARPVLRGMECSAVVAARRTRRLRRGAEALSQALRLELGIPVEIIEPAHMQIVRRE